MKVTHALLFLGALGLAAALPTTTLVWPLPSFSSPCHHDCRIELIALPGNHLSPLSLQPPKGKGVALEVDSDPTTGDDATEEDIEGEEAVCHTYKNKNARIELCEMELDEYMSEGKRVAKTHLYLTNVGDVGVW